MKSVGWDMLLPLRTSQKLKPTQPTAEAAAASPSNIRSHFFFQLPHSTEMRANFFGSFILATESFFPSPPLFSAPWVPLFSGDQILTLSKMIY